MCSTQPTILLLQELEADLTCISDALASRYNVIQTRSVDEALRALEEMPDAVNLVLAALHLHEACSFDLLLSMKHNASTNSIPFAFCCLRPSYFTRATANGISLAARVLGAQDLIIQDTFDADQLAEKITAILDAGEFRANEAQVMRPS